MQYLAHWGCEVTAISSSRDKEEQARSLGASKVIATRGTDELKQAARSFDFILCTVTAALPWDDYLAALRPRGKLCIVGIPDQPIAFRAFGLLGGQNRSSAASPGRRSKRPRC